MKWWSESEGLVYRSRFESLWSALPRVLVLATLPGWGKRTFMLQCADYLRSRDPAMRIVWTEACADLGAQLDAAYDEDATSVLACVDARAARDDFWEHLADALTTRPWATAMVASYDAPAQDVTRFADEDALSRVVLHEPDLAFDAVELADLSALLAASGAVFDTLMGGQERGCAALIGKRITRMLSRGGQGAWTLTAPSVEAQLLNVLREESAAADTFRGSRIGAVLSSAVELPSFTADLIECAAGGEREAKAMIARLAALPLFDVDEDGETGSEMCVWTPASWEVLGAGETRDETRARLAPGLTRARDADRLVLELRILLELGDVDEAEALAKRVYRRLLLLCDTRTAQMVREHPLITAQHHPMLMMMRNQFILRTEAFSPGLRADDREVLAALLRETAAGWFDEVARVSRVGYAASAAGNRSVADRYLTSLVALITEVETPVQSEASEDDRLRVVDACFLGYWCALQIDRLEDALTLAEGMRVWGREADRLHQFESVCREAVQDHAGLRSLEPDGTAPQYDPFNQAGAFIALEDGNDEAALHAVQRFIAELGTHNSRSSPDGFGLLLLAVTSQDAVTVGRIESALRDSAEFWDDHRPSTFVVWAGTLALSAIGAKAEARQWVDRISDRTDVYAHLARASYALWDGRPEGALDEVSAALRLTNQPRIAIYAQMLGIAAHARLGNLDRAQLRLEEAWRSRPAPRLFRFALRFLPQSAFVELSAAIPPSLPVIRATFEEAATDPRMLTWTERPNLTPTEREILRMLGRGDSNAAIANARYITVGTLRTHLKSLYKKLGAANRVEALILAARFELIEVWEGDTQGGEIPE